MYLCMQKIDHAKKLFIIVLHVEQIIAIKIFLLRQNRSCYLMKIIAGVEISTGPSANCR